jgi:hypothetical protein
MTTFPPLTHVALTVTDLSVSVLWYRALFDADPVTRKLDKGREGRPGRSSGLGLIKSLPKGEPG